MSFILDALKKLEQKRNQDTIPDLLTIHSPPVRKPQKRPVWFSMIVIALLINAGILLVWLKPWQTDQTDVEGQQSSEQPEQAFSVPVHKPDKTEPSPPSAVPEKATEPSVAVPDVITYSSDSSATPDSAIQASSPSEKIVDVTRTLTDERNTDTSLSRESDASGRRTFLPDEEELGVLREKIKGEIDYSASSPSDEPTLPDHVDRDNSISHQKVIDMNQLPSDIRNELPKISINAHIYSDNPSSRVVNINGIILREGDDIARGLTLEEITSSGVILTYRDHRFRIRAF